MQIKEKRVLVTGADGFIGSHLVEILLAREAIVRALVCYNSFNSWGWLEGAREGERLRIVSGDVRDPNQCRKIMKDIDVVFNLAALIAIPYSYIAPDSYVETNVKGALNICQAALEAGVKRVVQISTSEVYGTAKYVPIDENHPLQPQSPYSASKIASDAIAMSFYNAFHLPLVLVRPFNTYGPRQSARAVIPSIITQVASGLNEVRLGDPEPTRDFNFVLDTCRGIVMLAEIDAAVGETVNLGSNTEISIGDAVRLILSIMGSNAKLVHDPDRLRPRDSEVRRLVCDNSKIRRLVGYEPQYDFDTGIRKTVEWFIKPENISKYKAGIYNV